MVNCCVLALSMQIFNRRILCCGVLWDVMQQLHPGYGLVFTCRGVAWVYLCSGIVRGTLPGCGDTCCSFTFEVPWNCVCWDGV